MIHIIIGKDATHVKREFIKLATVIEDFTKANLNDPPTCLWPEIENGMPVSNEAMMIAVLDLLIEGKKKKGIIATLHEIPVVMIQSMIRNKMIDPPAVEFSFADEHGREVIEHSMEGGFVFWPPVTWEDGFYLRFDNPVADLPNFEKFQTL